MDPFDVYYSQVQRGVREEWPHSSILPSPQPIASYHPSSPQGQVPRGQYLPTAIQDSASANPLQPTQINPTCPYNQAFLAPIQTHHGVSAPISATTQEELMNLYSFPCSIEEFPACYDYPMDVSPPMSTSSMGTSPQPLQQMTQIGATTSPCQSTVGLTSPMGASSPLPLLGATSPSKSTVGVTSPMGASSQLPFLGATSPSQSTVGVTSPMEASSPLPSISDKPGSPSSTNLDPQTPFPSIICKLQSLASELNMIHDRIILKTNKILAQVTLVPSGNNFMKNMYDYFMHYNPGVIEDLTFCNNVLKNVVDVFLLCNIKSRWDYQQKCEALGSPLNNLPILKGLSTPCKNIFHLVIEILQKIQLVNPNNIQKTIQGYFPLSLPIKQCFQYLRMFLNETFLVMQKPPLIISPDIYINKTLPLSVCLLSGPFPNFTNAKGQPVVKLKDEPVQAYVIEEKQVITLINEGLEKLLTKIQSPACNRHSGRLDNGIGTVKEDGGLLVAKFPLAKIGKDKESTKNTNARGNASVLEQKHCLLFTLEFQVFEETFHVWTVSIPIGVSSHGSQKGLGLAVVIRDYITDINAARMLGAQLATPSPETISWTLLSKVIRIMFRKFLEDDTLSLSDDNLDCIKGKVEHTLIQSSVPVCFEEIKWSALSSKAFSPGLNFTFWDWLSDAFRTIKAKEILPLWKKGLIFGFVERNKAQELLSKKRIDGNFLLRFSDRVPGTLSVVVYQKDKVSPVCHLSPVPPKDLANLLKEKEQKGYSLSYIYGSEETSKCELLGSFLRNSSLPGYV